ncbi:protein-disulfide reductase DsbD family protein [Vibrio sp. FNV 38]|nr:protein-disulfide reductase DsbD family protein [Vibrio sp. FNV 38]
MHNLIQRARCIATLLLMTIISFSAHAQTVGTPWLMSPNHPPVQVKLTLTGDVDTQSKTVFGFIHVLLSDDWKTYWREPGEGGIAPSLNWQAGSSNISHIDWFWPYPEQFSLFGIRTIGYQADVTFPIQIQVSKLDVPVRLNSVLTLPTCTTLCVLTDYAIDIEFEPNQLVSSAQTTHQFAKAMSLVPVASSDIAHIDAVWDDHQQRLQVDIEPEYSWHSPEILPFTVSNELELIFEPLAQSQQDGVHSVVYEVSSWMGDVDLSEVPVAFHIRDEQLLVELAVQPELGAVTLDSLSLQSASVWTVLAWGVIGGLILNIMPCVLPVLGMKLSSVLGAQGVARQQIRKQFLFTSGGIVFSFWLIASVLSILKLGGGIIGWGIQFQSVWFLLLMMSVTALFAFNMFGLIVVSLPSRLASWVAQKGDNSNAGHFIQGMFATLLATPCSAPFLTTAIAYAFGADIPTMFVIFTSLALGMSLPWLLIAAFPRLVWLLPKPGRWMLWLKAFFGVMMLATSLWLLTLLRHHIPVLWVIFIACAVLIWLLGRVRTVYGDKWMLTVGVSALGLVAGSLIIGSMTTKSWVTPLPAEPDWVSLSQSAIKQAVLDGNTVFVDVSADWCITCKSNKIGVLLQEPIYSQLQSNDVIPMQGDWTRAQPSVTEFLRENQRFGVPFNIIYGPAAPQGIALPVILTDNVVLDAFKQARGVE